MVWKQPANTGDMRDVGSIPGSGKSHGEGNGNPPQCFCLGNPIEREPSWVTVHRVMEEWDITE